MSKIRYLTNLSACDCHVHGMAMFTSCSSSTFVGLDFSYKLNMDVLPSMNLCCGDSRHQILSTLRKYAFSHTLTVSTVAIEDEWLGCR